MRRGAADAPAGRVADGSDPHDSVEGSADRHLLGIHPANETVPRGRRVPWNAGFLLRGATMPAADGRRRVPGAANLVGGLAAAGHRRAAVLACTRRRRAGEGSPEAMLPCQRALFDLPREVCYLNAAGWSPLPLAVQAAGRAGVGRKGRPWELAPDFAAGQHERARAAAARLINADPDDVALIPSISYGVATAGRAIGPLPAGSRALVLEDDHSSPVLEWLTRAPAEGFAVETVRRPGNGDWAAALLDAVERPGAPPVAVASVSSVHWSDGGALALEDVSRALRARGAALVVDATHAVGVVRTDVAALDPDFLVFPTYKWALGPYGRAFLYVAKRWQGEGCAPLEQTAHGRRGVAADRVPYLRDLSFAPGARRFDMGERDHFVSLEMAAVGMEMMAAWGAEAVAARLRALTDRMAEELRDVGGVRPALADGRLRAPNLLCLEFPGGAPAGLVERLAAGNVHVAARVGRVRVSPHVYNDEEDADRFVGALREALRRA